MCLKYIQCGLLLSHQITTLLFHLFKTAIFMNFNHNAKSVKCKHGDYRKSPCPHCCSHILRCGTIFKSLVGNYIIKVNQRKLRKQIVPLIKWILLRKEDYFVENQTLANCNERLCHGGGGMECCE